MSDDDDDLFGSSAAYVPGNYVDLSDGDSSGSELDDLQREIAQEAAQLRSSGQKRKASPVRKAKATKQRAGRPNVEFVKRATGRRQHAVEPTMLNDRETDYYVAGAEAALADQVGPSDPKASSAAAALKRTKNLQSLLKSQAKELESLFKAGRASVGDDADGADDADVDGDDDAAIVVEPPAKREKLNVFLRLPTGKKSKVTMFKDSKFAELYRYAENKLKKTPVTIVFDGLTVGEDETPETHELEDEDLLDAS